MSKTYSFTVEQRSPDAKRLDYFLSEHIPELSRSAVQKAIKLGLVKVVRSEVDVEVKNKLKLLSGDIITLSMPEVAIYEDDISIIYEDDDIIVINKPCGLLVHDKPTDFKDEQSLVDIISAKVGGSVERGGIVHRLDRTTSGVMVVARTSVAQTKLKKQFANREVEKIYIALSSNNYDGSLPLIIDAPIQRDKGHKAKFIVSPTGKASKTTVIASQSDPKSKSNLFVVKPHTGRTHQIRVHLAYINHPIIGDSLYNKNSTHADRVMLHAYRLSLVCPDGQKRQFIAPVAKEFIDYLSQGTDFELNLDKWLKQV